MSSTQQHKGLYVVPCWINGEAATFDSARLIEVESAAQDKIVHYAQSASVEVANKAVEAAGKAFKTFSETPYNQRRSILMKAADILESRVDELARYQIEETSCPEAWARFNVMLAAKAVREIAANITIACTGEMPPPETGSAFCLVYKQAIGPVLSIAPWNGSVILSSRTLAAPLAAGCTVVFKASEMSPRTHEGVVQAFLAAGVPEGAINQIQVNRDDASSVVETIIAHPTIRKVEFIGSAVVGQIIGQVAARHLKPVLMELGGKNAALVLKDADLKRAAALSVQGAVMHHGQVCMSTDRIIVEEAVAAEFMNHLRDAVTPMQDNAGFAVSKAMARKAQELVASATDQGASFIAGSNQWRGETGAALQPTFITGVNAEDRIRNVETFGPSAAVYVVADENEAIELANEPSYGLTGAIFTKDILKGLRLAKKMEVGVVAINDMTLWEESPVPMGGIKGSGWGKNNSRFGVEEFLISKAVAVVDHVGTPAFGSA